MEQGGRLPSSQTLRRTRRRLSDLLGRVELDQTVIHQTLEDLQDLLFTHGTNLQDGSNTPITADSRKDETLLRGQALSLELGQRHIESGNVIERYRGPAFFVVHHAMYFIHEQMGLTVWIDLEGGFESR